jgi:CRP-like cAMP-binding protein
MGAHLPIRTADATDARPRAFTPAVAFTPDARGHFSAEVFAEAADRIRQSMRQSANDAPETVATLVADALELTSGERIRDQARLARQMLLWHQACPPEQARDLTVAALADRAGALRRSVSRRHLEGSPGE